MIITPTKTRLFAPWESEDHYLRIRLNSQFRQNIARDTLEHNDDRTIYTTQQKTIVQSSVLRDRTSNFSTPKKAIALHTLHNQ